MSLIQSVLLKTVFDRSPIVLDNGGITRVKSSFTFENMQLKMEGFKDLVRNLWSDYNVRGS